MRPLIIAVMCLGSTFTSVHGLEQRSLVEEQDSILAVYKNALMGLRDSVDLVRGALDQFRRDLQPAGERTVIFRATRLNERCTALGGSLQVAEPVFRAYRAPTNAAREANGELLGEMRALEAALSSHCLEGLAVDGPGVRADSLKAWGPHHTSKLRHALSAFHARAVATADALGIELDRQIPGRGSLGGT